MNAYITYYSFIFTESQLWYFITTPIPGVFYIASRWNSEYVMTATMDENGAPITIERKTLDFSPTQLWKFVPVGGNNGYNMIQHYTQGGYYLDVDALNPGYGNDIHMWEHLGTPNQQLMVTPLSVATLGK